VVDNPYVAVTATDYKRRSNFTLDGVPPGKHTVEVWHAFCEPVRRTFEVEIEQDRIKEIRVDFHPPGVSGTPPASVPMSGPAGQAR